MKKLLNENLRTIEETAKFLGISSSTVKRLIQKGTLPFVRLGKLYYISENNLKKFINGETITTIADNIATEEQEISSVIKTPAKPSTKPVESKSSESTKDFMSDYERKKAKREQEYAEKKAKREQGARVRAYKAKLAQNKLEINEAKAANIIKDSIGYIEKLVLPQFMDAKKIIAETKEEFNKKCPLPPKPYI